MSDDDRDVVEAEGDRLSLAAQEAVRRYADFRRAHPDYRSWVEREDADEDRPAAPVVELHRDRHGPHPDRTGDGV